jgi:hypothetical protein
MSTEVQLPADAPVMKAWRAYQKSDDYQNSFQWAAKPEHRDGSMWAAYLKGGTDAIQQVSSPVCPGCNRAVMTGDPNRIMSGRLWHAACATHARSSVVAEPAEIAATKEG